MIVDRLWHRELYSKERYIGGLADRLRKVTLVPVTTWHMPWAQYDLYEERHYTKKNIILVICPLNALIGPVTRYLLLATRHPLPVEKCCRTIIKAITRLLIHLSLHNLLQNRELLLYTFFGRYIPSVSTTLTIRWGGK